MRQPVQVIEEPVIIMGVTREYKFGERCGGGKMWGEGGMVGMGAAPKFASV